MSWFDTGQIPNTHQSCSLTFFCEGRGGERKRINERFMTGEKDWEKNTKPCAVSGMALTVVLSYSWKKLPM